MDDHQRPQFFKRLAEVLASYAKPLPEKGILAAWWANLQPFPIGAVEMSFDAYMGEHGEFPPTPAGIAMRCRLMDGRPGSEEAFALALTTLDEQNTVVWTQECAEAFAKARPVLDSSGAISARKTFAEIYDRLVVTARANRQPVQWFPSPGLDKIGYAAAIKRAVVAGLLPAPAATLQLEAPKDEAFSLDPRQQLGYIRTMILDDVAQKQARADAEIDARIEAEDEISAEIQRKVDQHMGGAA